MKKTLLIITLLMSSIMCTQAQCTITPGCSTATGYCSTPAANSALPNATELAGYSTVIQVSIASSFSVATVTNGTVTSVTGLPTGLTYSTNPANGVINGGGSGCLLISGTPAAGTAGSYTITANVTVNTNFGAFPTTLAWTLTVDAVSGIEQYVANSASVLIMPNPASNNITVTSNVAADNSSIQVIDMLGNNLIQTNLQQGKVTIDISNLQQGVYFIKSNKRIQKFIKQ